MPRCCNRDPFVSRATPEVAITGQSRPGSKRHMGASGSGRNRATVSRPRTSRTRSRACQRSGARERPSTTPARHDGDCPPGSATRGTSAGSRQRRCGPGPGSPFPPEPGRGVVLEQHEGGPVPARQAGPDPPGRFSDRDDATSLGDNSQVTRRSGRSGPDTQMPDPFPRQAPRRVPPERVINEQPAKRRKVIRGGRRQSFHR